MNLVSTLMYEVQEASRGMTYPPLKSRSTSNANNDVAGSPLGFGGVMFSAPEEVASAPAFAPLFVAPSQPVEAFLA